MEVLEREECWAAVPGILRGTELANDGIQSGCRMEVVYEGLQVRWRWERTGVGPGLGG